MALAFACPACHTSFSSRPLPAGSVLACPSCGTRYALSDLPVAGHLPEASPVPTAAVAAVDPPLAELAPDPPARRRTARRLRGEGLREPRRSDSGTSTILLAVVIPLMAVIALAFLGWVFIGNRGALGPPRDTVELHARVYGKTADEVVRVMGKPDRIIQHQRGPICVYADRYEGVTVLIDFEYGIVTGVHFMPEGWGK